MANPFDNPSPEGQQANISRTERRRRIRGPPVRHNNHGAIFNTEGSVAAPRFQPPLQNPQSTPLYPPSANVTHNVNHTYSDHASSNLIWDSDFDPLLNPTPLRGSQPNVRSVFSPISPTNVTATESHNSTMMSSMSMDELLDELHFTPRGPESTNLRPPSSSNFRFSPTGHSIGSNVPAAVIATAKRQQSMCDSAYNRIESLGREHLDPNMSNSSVIGIPVTVNPRVRFADNNQPSNITSVANFNNYTNPSNTIPLSTTVSSSVPFSFVGSSAPFSFQSEFARGLADQTQDAQMVGQLPQVSAGPGIERSMSANVPCTIVGADAFKNFKYGPISATSDKVQTTSNVAGHKAVTTSAGGLDLNSRPFNFNFGHTNDRSSLNTATSTRPSFDFSTANTTTVCIPSSGLHGSTNGISASVARNRMSTTTVTPSSTFSGSTPSVSANNTDISRPPPPLPSYMGGTLPKGSRGKGIPESGIHPNLPPFSAPNFPSQPNHFSTHHTSGTPVTSHSYYPTQPGFQAQPEMPAHSGSYNHQNGVPGYYNIPNSNNAPQNFDYEFLIKEITSRLAQNNVSSVASTTMTTATSTSNNATRGSDSNSKISFKNKRKNNKDKRRVRTAEEPSSSGDSSSSSSSENGAIGVNPGVADNRTNNSRHNRDPNMDVSDVGGATYIPNTSYHKRHNQTRNVSRSHALNLTEAERTILYRNGVTDSDIETRAIQISASNNFATSQTPQIVYAAPLDHVVTFSGNMEDYELWKSDLMAYIVTVPESIRFKTLNNKLPTGVQNKIAMYTGSTQKAFDLALKALDTIYDNPTAVVQILTDQICFELDPACANDRVKFSNMIANLRNKFNRIFAINALSIANLNGFLTQFMNCLPREVKRDVAKIRHRKPAKFCFKKILEMAEDFDDLSWSQRYGAESRSFVQYYRNPSNDRDSRPSSRGSSYERPKHDSHNNNKYHKNHNSHQVYANSVVSTNSTVSENCNMQPTVAMAVSGNESAGSSSNNSKFKSSHNSSQDSSTRGRSPHKQPFSQPRGRSQSINRSKCLICSTNDHFTVLCPAEKESKELQEIVQERKICTYCGKGGHFNTSCYNVELGFKSDLVCQNKSNKCKNTPHVQRFCSIYQSA